MKLTGAWGINAQRLAASFKIRAGRIPPKENLISSNEIMTKYNDNEKEQQTFKNTSNPYFAVSKHLEGFEFQTE